MLLANNMIRRFYFDIYENCHFKAMTLLKVKKLNGIQRENVRYLRNLLNEIDDKGSSPLSVKDRVHAYAIDWL